MPDAVKRMSDSFGKMQKVGAVMTGVGTAVTGACLGTVTATFDTQNALAEVASLGVKDLSKLEKAAKSFLILIQERLKQILSLLRMILNLVLPACQMKVWQSTRKWRG